MKFELKLDLIWLLKKLRILFLLAVFWLLYRYVGQVWAFIWIIFFILNDLSDIESNQEQDKEERLHAWRNTLMKRKDF